MFEIEHVEVRFRYLRHTRSNGLLKLKMPMKKLRSMVGLLQLQTSKKEYRNLMHIMIY